MMTTMNVNREAMRSWSKADSARDLDELTANERQRPIHLTQHSATVRRHHDRSILEPRRQALPQ